MPTYEYVCGSCGTHVEVFQRFSDPPLTECGVCGGPLRKVFHPAGILFKGSGFYVTDSRSAARSKAGAGTSTGEGSSSSGDGGSGSKETTSTKESKPSTSPGSTSGSKKKEPA